MSSRPAWSTERVKMLYPCPLCTTRKERDNTMGSKSLFNHRISRVTNQSGLHYKGSGALLFLAAQSRDRSGVCKHKTINTAVRLQLHFPPIRIQEVEAFLKCSLIANQHRMEAFQPTNQIHLFFLLLETAISF